MMGWIAAQSTPIVALTMLVLSYGLAAMAYAVVACAHRCGHGATLRGISPVTLTPLVMMFGLFVGFLAADVWPSFERARAAVGQEAMALREAVLLADALPPDARANLRAAVRAHITYAVKEEWPAMSTGAETLRRLPRELMRGTTDLLAKPISVKGFLQAVREMLPSGRVDLG